VDGTDPGLARFNGLDEADARRELSACCSAPDWADKLLAGRPYASVQQMLGQSDAAAAGLSAVQLADALAGHPRIGELPAGGTGGRPPRSAAGAGTSKSAGWSRREQAAALGSDAQTLQALADGNLAYEQRFGHIYLVCASGRSAAELLAVLQDRLANDDEREWQVVRTELAKINQIRLRALLGQT
jgi:2-oxo-4-hydroxy-4-carboxy-5-ureidoimidazoline decarboxylase